MIRLSKWIVVILLSIVLPCWADTNKKEVPDEFIYRLMTSGELSCIQKSITETNRKLLVSTGYVMSSTKLMKHKTFILIVSCFNKENPIDRCVFVYWFIKGKVKGVCMLENKAGEASELMREGI